MLILSKIPHNCIAFWSGVGRAAELPAGDCRLRHVAKAITDDVNDGDIADGADDPEILSVQRDDPHKQIVLPLRVRRLLDLPV